MTNPRILTLLVLLDSENHPTWLWENHKNGIYSNGLNILAICEGNQIQNDEEKQMTEEKNTFKDFVKHAVDSFDNANNIFGKEYCDDIVFTILVNPEEFPGYDVEISCKVKLKSDD